MEWIFVAMAAASLAYGIVVLLLNGLLPFFWIWPCFALLHLLVFGILRHLKRKRRKKEKVRVRPYVYALATYGMGLVILIALIVAIFQGAHTEERANLDYVIVLGTDLRDNKISPSLRRRLDAAVQYAGENKHTVFVLSGGKGKYDKTTQATAMYYYMIQHGVPAANLLIEFYSRSTLEKVGFSVQTILEDQEDRASRRGQAEIRLDEEMHLPEGSIIFAEDKPLSVGILTSEFNLLRAVRMARRFGLKDICPMSTPSDELVLAHLCVTEALAIFKDRLIGNI